MVYGIGSVNVLLHSTVKPLPALVSKLLRSRLVTQEGTCTPKSRPALPLAHTTHTAKLGASCILLHSTLLGPSGISHDNCDISPSGPENTLNNVCTDCDSTRSSYRNI